MNRISINLKYGDSVQLTDNEDIPKDQLLENLSTLFSVNSVAILQTTNSSVIIRPSDIASIKVDQLETVVDEKIEEKPLPSVKIDHPEHVDIITDVD